MSDGTQSSLTSYKDLIFGHPDKPESNAPFCETMEQTLKRYVLEKYTSLEDLGKEIGIAKSTIYDYFKYGIPDDVFAVICFRLRLHPSRVMHLIFKGTKYKLDFNGDERNSLIVNYLILCHGDDSYNLESCNAELKARELRLINQNA